MATIEEQVKQLEAAYAKATTVGEYHAAFLSAVEAAKQPGLSPDDRMRLRLPGLWAFYYEFRSSGEKDDEGLFASDLMSWMREITDIDLIVRYYYLLSTVLGELGGKTKEAQEASVIARQLAGDNVSLILRAVAAQGDAEMRSKQWQRAIQVYSEPEKNYSLEVLSKPDARQIFANILNNRGLSELNMSDEKQGRGEKRDLIATAIVDLRDAEELYMATDPPPLKHIDGLENRLIMAAIRLLLTEHFVEEAEIAQKIQDAFVAKKREEAKNHIMAIQELKVKSWDRIEGNIPGDTWPFIQSIQLGLKMADEFLEQHKTT